VDFSILGYATVVGVEWCVLTNGDKYRLYNAHAPVDVEEKLFRAVRISDPQADFTAETLGLLSKAKVRDNFLNVLWKSHFIDRNVKNALEDLLRNEDPAFVRLLKRKTVGLNPSDIRLSLKRAVLKVDYPVVPAGLMPQAAPSENRKEPTKGKVRPAPKRSDRKVPVRRETDVLDLIRRGVIQAPLELERKYKGTVLTATLLEDGTIRFAGKGYNSLSTASGMARKSIIGAPPGRAYPQTNGWTFWQFRDRATGKLVEMDSKRSPANDHA
jgi:hypothetical protein